MTIAQFYVALAKKTQRTHTRWHVNEWDEIRLAEPFSSHCPVSFVADGPKCNVVFSARTCGLRISTAEAIAKAADRAEHSRHRSRLLEACGLESW